MHICKNEKMSRMSVCENVLWCNVWVMNLRKGEGDLLYPEVSRALTGLSSPFDRRIVINSTQAMDIVRTVEGFGI